MKKNADVISKHEELVAKHIREGNTDEAIKSLLFLITKYAQGQDFETAETLREKIISVDPMALTEAIKAHEIIERARTSPSDKGHMEIWAKLYDKLTIDEANTLFNDMQDVVFRPGQAIFEQGGNNSNLYFCNSGQAKHLYTKDNREIFIKKVAPGNIAGEDTFFDASLCTTSLVAIDKVKMQYLDRDTLNRWRHTAPELEAKVRSFSDKETKVHDLLKKNAMDRRTQKRVGLPGRVLIKLVNEEGVPIGKTLRGNMGDVSVGGVSFHINVKDRTHAQLLLGRRLHVKFSMPPTMSYVERLGLALGVRFNGPGSDDKDDYSVHIKFEKMLGHRELVDAEKFQKVVAIQR
ncbi:MAG: cyclic nucleotide-binding domain-containing protein [Proteobacteria bacterium]|nr:cyclic nucleotide-binding domain-containing protein [Pseudomonadota bacterium]MBU1737125.1 cyclic nucleotide-binding domain-containing protein [Pseudomonadota bacterium]